VGFQARRTLESTERAARAADRRARRKRTSWWRARLDETVVVGGDVLQEVVGDKATALK
jgi:hypothetical protein